MDTPTTSEPTTTGKPIITSWSFSSLMSYEECPHRFRLKAEGHKRQEENVHAQEGRAIHKEIDQYMRGIIGQPDYLEPFLPAIAKIDSDFETETEYAFDNHWQLTDWNTAWLRFIPDVMYVDNERFVHVWDWKTGKRVGREVKHSQQANLYMVCAHALYPDAPGYYAQFFYTKLGTSWEPKVFTPDKVAALRSTFTQRANRMLSDTELRPKPSKSVCRFCDFNHVCQYAVME